MESLKLALLFVQSHWASLSAVAVLAGRMLAPLVAPFVKAKLPRLAHLCAAVAAMSPDIVPFAKALFRAVTGVPFDAPPPAGAAK